VRSVLASLEKINVNDASIVTQDWQVQITVHGIAGLELVPVSSLTEFVPLESLGTKSKLGQQQHNRDKGWNPLVSNVTHACQWDSMIHVPLRWRDLPRDAYLKFSVKGPRDNVVRDSRKE
jgi:hypothetical protein